MKHFLYQAYLNPEKTTFHFLENLRAYWWIWSLAFLLIPLAYPIFQYAERHYRLTQQEQSVEQLQQKITQQHRKLTSLQQFYSQKNQQDSEVAARHHQIKQLLDQEKAHIETMQWRFEQGKQVELVIHQTSPTVFRLIEQLSQLPKLAFQEIHLTKLHYQQQIQLSAKLLVQP